MHLSYDPETDSLYIAFVDRPGAHAAEVAPGIVMDYDAEGRAVVLDIEYASKLLDLTVLESEYVPFRQTRFTA